MGLGDFISNLFGSKNKATAKAPTLDPNAYNYGGYAGGANDATDRYQGLGRAAQGRQGPQVNYTQANVDRALGRQARTDQQGLAGMMAARARGEVPSIAQMQADRQMQQAAAAQTSQAAGARGAGALALAQQTAANNTSNAQAAISGQAQINAANERMAAEQAAFGAYSNIRGGDLASQQQAAQQQQYQSGLEMQQRGLNDQATMGYEQLGNSVQMAQLGASQNRQAQQSANALGASGINAGVGGQNAQMNQQNAWGVLGMARDAAGATGLFKADGGPVSAGRPYIVGERGPELVIPANHGTVIPAEQTSQMLAPSTWGTGGPDAQAQQQAAQEARVQSAIGREMVRQANAYESPYARDVRQVQVLRQLNPELVSEEDDTRERRGLAMMGMQRKDAAKEKETAKKEDEKTPAPAAKREDTLDRLQSSRTPSYQAMGGYIPPQLLALPARASGGPVTGGMPVLVGEQGPEMVVPTFDKMAPGGGMDVLGSLRAHSNFATQYQRQPGASPMSYGAREDGGPVAPGRRYLVGESGPEMVIPLYEPPGKQLNQDFGGRAFFTSAPSEETPLAGGGLAAMSSQPVVARTPVKLKAGASPERQLSEEELRRAADALGRQMRVEHNARMAAGPAVKK